MWILPHTQTYISRTNHGMHFLAIRSGWNKISSHNSHRNSLPYCSYSNYYKMQKERRFISRNNNLFYWYLNVPWSSFSSISGGLADGGRIGFGGESSSGGISGIVTPNVPCPPGMFRCNDGKCITSLWVCNYQKDCEGGEDEQQSCRKFIPKESFMKLYF